MQELFKVKFIDQKTFPVGIKQLSIKAKVIGATPPDTKQGDFGGPLVMTSGNRSDEPICFEDADARRRLTPLADAFLGHDRPIHRRCEDSVLRRQFPIRRSRGLAPSALRLPVSASRPLLATGAELKNTFCVVRGAEAFLSPHLGDLDEARAYQAFLTDLELYTDMLGLEPEVIACDMHPDYVASKWAREQGLETIEVQHHHAHDIGRLRKRLKASNGVEVRDGFPEYGKDFRRLLGIESDQAMELFHQTVSMKSVGNLTDFVRLGHLEPVPLPGGEAAIRQPWRSAAAYLEACGRPVPFSRWRQVRQSLQVNAPLSSGMGRLFDAVAAILGLRHEVSYEGQAAIELEWLAGEAQVEPYRCSVADGVIAGPELVAAAYDDHLAGRPAAEIAAAFHEGVAAAAVQACAQAAFPKRVVLSGGSFQNLRLVHSVRRRLGQLGFEVLTHQRVPPNDGGISFGQAAIAAWRTSCA